MKERLEKGIIPRLIHLGTAEEEEEASVLVDRLAITTTRCKMKIGTDKTKVMPNNPNDVQREIKIKGQARVSAELQVHRINHLMNGQNPRFFPGKPRQQQLLLD